MLALKKARRVGVSVYREGLILDISLYDTRGRPFDPSKNYSVSVSFAVAVVENRAGYEWESLVSLIVYRVNMQDPADRITPCAKRVGFSGHTCRNMSSEDATTFCSSVHPFCSYQAPASSLNKLHPVNCNRFRVAPSSAIFVSLQ